MATGQDGGLYSSADSLTVHVNYPLRLTICILSSFFGLQLLAWADCTGIRLLGIAMASLSSNLGDMSFLQLCSHYPNTAFGGYTTGSGCAALVGAFIYTFSTSTLHFSPSDTISVIGIFPVVILITYALLLPDPSCTSAKRALPASSRRSSIAEDSISSLPALSKLRIARPLFWRYMAPLALVMLLENTVVQGVLPTLLFPLPFPDSSSGYGLLNKVFRHTRDFYPVYVTVYQFSIFIGRSSISFFRPPGTVILCLFQAMILTLQVAESLSMSSNLPDTLYGPPAVLCAVAAMGLCGGFAFSETYWRVRNGALPKGVGEEDEEGERAMREFLLSAVAPPDTVAVLVASVVGMRVQGGLCAVQVAGGRGLCRHMGE
ncbi:batten's disease protein Cln3 [Morchella snyderi]|nr:batten's disease protein Cln3 [Morchella snyderi]